MPHKFLITTNSDLYPGTTFDKNHTFEATDLQNDALQLTMIQLDGYCAELLCCLLWLQDVINYWSQLQFSVSQKSCSPAK